MNDALTSFHPSRITLTSSSAHSTRARRQRKYTHKPLLVIVDVRPDVQGLPVQAYSSHEILSETMEASRTFSHITCEVGAYEAEEVGVEHLLRDINDPSLSTLGGELRAKLGGLGGLGEASLCVCVCVSFSLRAREAFL